MQEYTVWNQRGSLFTLILVGFNAPDGRKRYFIFDRHVLVFQADYMPPSVAELQIKVDMQMDGALMGWRNDFCAAIATLMVHPAHPVAINTTAFLNNPRLDHPISVHRNDAWEPRLRVGKLVEWKIAERTIVYYKSGYSHTHFLFPATRISYPCIRFNPRHYFEQSFCNASREMAVFYALQASESKTIAHKMHSLTIGQAPESTPCFRVTLNGNQWIVFRRHETWAQFYAEFDATTQAEIAEFLTE